MSISFSVQYTLSFLVSVIQNHTDLSSNDWRPNYEQHQFVKKKVKESNHRLQLSRIECCDAGLELGLKVVFHDAHISNSHRKHMLIQGMHQGKKLIQVLVLEKEDEKCFADVLVINWEKKIMKKKEKTYI